MDIVTKQQKRFVRSVSTYKQVDISVDVPSIPTVYTLSITSTGWTEWKIPIGTTAFRIECLDASVVKLAVNNTYTPFYTFKANFVYEVLEMIGMGGAGYSGIPLYFQTSTGSATLQITYWKGSGNLDIPDSSSSSSSSSSQSFSSSSRSSSSSSNSSSSSSSSSSSRSYIMKFEDTGAVVWTDTDSVIWEDR